jgi:methyl-accepting chemotaxis protein
MHLSLRSKFLFPTLILILIGMGLVTGVSLYFAQNNLKEVIKSDSRNLANSASERIAGFVNDRRLDVVSWSREKIYQTAVQDSFVGKSARQSANEQLAELKRDYKYYEDIFLANAVGEISAASTEALAGKFKVTDQDYFQASLKGAVLVTDVVMSRTTGKPSFVLSAPIMEKKQTIGVIFAVVDFGVLATQYITPLKMGETGYAYMFKKDGTIIAHPTASLILKSNMKDLGFGQSMMDGQEGESIHVFEGKERWQAFKKNMETGWTVVISATGEEILAPVRRLGYINLGLAGCVVFALTVVILLVVNSTVKPINRLITGLDAGSRQVTTSSVQVSSSSQQLAGGTSAQAASLEEISSSLEEMSSMTKQNADNANQANQLMVDTRNMFARAGGSLEKLIAAMSEISRAGEDTSKIVKTIDEIAFQTNLLALNAAVEAARAGEAGAGFAVVANEVRNLAMRAADAAKNTAQLIEGSIRKVKEGSELVDETEREFREVAASVGRSGELVGEISAASQEQAQGIEQVNRAVTELDRVVQQNAATAEESASASEELNSQAEQMKGFVVELEALVEGSNGISIMSRGKLMTSDAPKNAV